MLQKKLQYTFNILHSAKVDMNISMGNTTDKVSLLPMLNTTNLAT